MPDDTTPPPLTPHSRPSTMTLWGSLVLIAAIAFLSIAYLYLFRFYIAGADAKWDALAAVGQTLGAWATSISIVILIASLLSQRRQIRLQHDALVAQIEELQYQRTALQQTASAVAAQVFLQMLASAEKTLSRSMRAILTLVPSSHGGALDKLDQRENKTSDATCYAAYFTSTPEIRAFVKENAIRNPILHDAILRYCSVFDALQAHASAAQLPFDLFSVAMDNTAHVRAYALLKDAIR